MNLQVTVAFPCYKRFHTKGTRDLIASLSKTDVDRIIIGTTKEEITEHWKYVLDVLDNRTSVLPLVEGRGCGGDMKAVADFAVQKMDGGDVLIMMDDDIILNGYTTIKHWVNQWFEMVNPICAFPLGIHNYPLRIEQTNEGWQYKSVLRNVGPVLAFRANTYKESGGYNPEFHQANDVDLQQKFNLLGDSIVTADWRYNCGVFQEGGMSAFYGVSDSRKKYVINTGRALYNLKIRYPWLVSAHLAFRKGVTSAVYRTSRPILEQWRKAYEGEDISLGVEGLYVNDKQMLWPMSERDLRDLERAEELWKNL